MPSFICSACGTSYPPSEKPPLNCPLCEEERQLVPEAGQSWTTPEGLAARHLNAFREYEPGIIGIGSRPQFGIGQRALLVRTPNGNVLWDCISLLDARRHASIEIAQELHRGLSASVMKAHQLGISLRLKPKQGSGVPDIRIDRSNSVAD